MLNYRLKISYQILINFHKNRNSGIDRKIEFSENIEFDYNSNKLLLFEFEIFSLRTTTLIIILKTYSLIKLNYLFNNIFYLRIIGIFGKDKKFFNVK